MCGIEQTRKIWAEILAANKGVKIIDTCVVCGAKNILAIGVFRRSLCLNRCKSCGFVFLGPQKTENVYKPGHVQQHYIKSSINRGMLTAETEPVLSVIYSRYRKIADLTARLAPIDPVADIGCGIGLSMLALKHLGIESIGYDVNEEFIEQAKRFKLDARCEDIVSAPVQRYSVVTLSSMIEHLTNPVAFLESIRKNTLCQGGHVVVTAPNILSVDFVRDGENISNINGNHFWYFSNDTLSLALDRAGYDVVYVHRERREYKDPIMNNAQVYLESFLGVDENLTGGIGLIAKARSSNL